MTSAPTTAPSHCAKPSTVINAGNDLGDPGIAAQNRGSFGANDAIHFNIPGAGVHTVDLGTDASAPNMQLPIVTSPVVIDGYTQPGAAPNTLGLDDNAVLLIEINRTGAGFPAGTGNTIAFNSFAAINFLPPPNLAGAGNAILGNAIFSNGGLGSILSVVLRTGTG